MAQLSAAQKKKAAAEAKAKKEAKASKFVELAQKRTTKAINSLRSIRKLANRNSYVYTDEQTTKICEALRKEVVTLSEAFKAKTGEKAGGFEL